MLDAAELGALALEVAGRLGDEAQGVDAAGDGIHLPREGRNPPAVDDVHAGELELDGLVDREVEGVHGRFAVRVAVLPVELVRLDADRQVRLVFDAPCLHRRDLGEGEDREPREDDRGDRRPDDLEPGVAVDLRPLGALGRVAPAAEADDEEDERRLDKDEDDRAEAEDDPVETRDRLPARGLGARRTETSGSRERGPRAAKRQDKHGDWDSGNELPEA